MQMNSSDTVTRGRAGDALCRFHSGGTVGYVISPSLPTGWKGRRPEGREEIHECCDVSVFLLSL